MEFEENITQSDVLQNTDLQPPKPNINQQRVHASGRPLKTVRRRNHTALALLVTFIRS